MPKPEIKCPKCGETRATEIVNKWRTKTEIYCNTCGKNSVLDSDEPEEESED